MQISYESYSTEYSASKTKGQRWLIYGLLKIPNLYFIQNLAQFLLMQLQKKMTSWKEF